MTPGLVSFTCYQLLSPSRALCLSRSSGILEVSHLLLEIVLEVTNSYSSLSPDPTGQLTSLQQPLHVPPLCSALHIRPSMVGASLAMSVAPMEGNRPLILYIEYIACLLQLTSLALVVLELRDSVES